jgi:hypothetical protein
MTKNDLFKEGMEFLLISAMYRGYDIAIDDSFEWCCCKCYKTLQQTS